MQEAQNPSPTKAYTVVTHEAQMSDGTVRMITERIPYDSDVTYIMGLEPPETLFVGHARVTMSGSRFNPQTGASEPVESMREVVFPIPGEDISQAWASFDEAADAGIPAARDNLIARMNDQARRIVTA